MLHSYIFLVRDGTLIAQPFKICMCVCSTDCTHNTISTLTVWWKLETIDECELLSRAANGWC